MLDGPIVVTLLACALVGYLLGSIPFGLVLTRAFGTTDIRTIGSGNIGATNVLRTGRKGLAGATLLCDALKGTVAVLLCTKIGGWEGAYSGAVGALLGHLFPVWLRFRGGKGVATYLGILLGIDWRAGLVFVAVWIAVAAATRYSSAAALASTAVTPLALWLLGRKFEAELFVLFTALVWIMHGRNMARLVAGTEGKIGGKAPSQSG